MREPGQITLLEIVTLVEGEGKEKENSETPTIEKKDFGSGNLGTS